MQGLEISKNFYREYGEPMLREQFPELLDKIAVGLTGSGSECYGFDDDVSRDHDFEAGFCIFLPGEDKVDRRCAFLLERAYSKLPKEYAGLKRSVISPVGGNRHGVIRREDFFTDKVGAADGKLSDAQWLSIPEYALCEAVNGEVFYDGDGAFTAIREALGRYPEDIRRKKLAGNLLLMAQSGQYNYGRCLAHGESGAAQLAVNAFVESAMSCVFLLNGRYKPYYKWSFRAMRSLELLWQLADSFEFLLTGENTEENAEVKTDVIEDICALVIGVLKDQGLTDAVCGDLEKHAYSVNDSVGDAAIRNMHILVGV